MTEYGRGPGSAPWHPEDPYGDGGWGGQQTHTDPQSSYDGRPQHHPPQPQYGGWGDQQHYGEQYGQQHYTDPHQQPPFDPNQQQPHPGSPQQYPQPGWNDGTAQPYPADPYAHQGAPYGGEQPGPYGGGPDAYPQPESPGRRDAEPEPRPDWDPEPGQDDHAFFAGGGRDDHPERPGADQDVEDDGDGEDTGRRGRAGRRGRGGKGKKRRNGCACLVVVLVFGGGFGGAGYLGYHFYKDRFAAPPDYAGDGTGEMVTVVIPKGSFGSVIGRKLKDAGVVKSVDAFVAAQKDNPDGARIQAGAYLLRKHMSAKSAVAMMLDPKSQANVLVTPGERNARVYADIDTKLGLPAGTTKGIAEKQYRSLGLPNWANTDTDIKDPLEGFLYPGTYPAAKGMKPEAVLKEMVSHANQAYGKYDLAAKAEALGLKGPLQVVTVASLVQAEGKTHDDYRKMAEVVYNRLKPTNTETNQLLQFDSTFNYLKGQSNIHISESEINSNTDPYNTYTHKGLPPGPIGNPGDDALKATLNPTHDGWIYFVATDGENNTEFAKTYAEVQRLKEKFNASSGN
jgi:UPF0755 protein